MMIKGIGTWTTDYVMMKRLHYTSAFPVADVGPYNALKSLLGPEETVYGRNKRYAVDWEGWQAYAAFYLWRSLYDKST